MTLRTKMTWITLTVMMLLLNSIVKDALWMVFLNLIPLAFTCYIIVCHHKEFRYNTPWGIPYFLLTFLNIRRMEEALRKATNLYVSNNTIAVLLQFAFVFIVAATVLVLVRRKQTSLS
ncbi:MAG: hypothetical protein JWQ25_1269 [Daejeonella sp.]|nr:hypothetical protein [Daejeonella sp.]